MYKANKKHLQPLLISTINDLPEKYRQRLEQSWAGTFYKETFIRIPEDLFEVLYSTLPSRPNVPVNVLVGLDLLKAHFGWSDEEMYDHFMFDVQVRYALGYHSLKEGDFEIRTLYYFRRSVANHFLKTGENLLQKAFEQMTDQQALAHKVDLRVQRMDSTQIMSNIVDASRLQLLVETIQRLVRVLSAAEREHYAELLAPYVERRAHQFIYPVKGKDAWNARIEEIGQVMYRLVTDLAPIYDQEPIFQVFKRIFEDNYRVEEQTVRALDNAEIPSGCLQSVDDLEATYRKKGPKGFKGYVANLSESCTPGNDLQLITQLQVAPNNQEDADLLTESMSDLKARTGLESLYVDALYGNSEVDEACIDQKVELVQTGIRGNAPDPEKFNLADFDIVHDKKGKPVEMTCPAGQTVMVEPGRTTGYIARFDPEKCQDCRFFQENHCRVQGGKKDPRPRLNFTQQEVNWAKRRRRHNTFKEEDGNLRTAVEASIRSLKHPFPNGKLPVRGLFRVTYMLLGSAAMINMRRIHRYLSEKEQSRGDQKVNKKVQKAVDQSALDSFLVVMKTRLEALGFLSRSNCPCFGY
jgi:hypothetical protein